MHAACLTLLLTATSLGTDAPVMVLSEQRVVSARSWSIDGSGQLIVEAVGQGDSPESILVGAPALLDVSRSPRPVARRHGPDGAAGASAVIQLINGEILRGAILEPDSPGTVRFDAADFGPQRLALAKIAVIRLAGRRLSQPAGRRLGDPPYLLLANGDVISGAIKVITPAAVTVDSEFGEAKPELSRIAAIALAADPPPADGRAAGQLICSLADGQRWYVDAVAAGPGNGQLRVERAGSTVDLPADSVQQLVFAGWTIRELIALAPPEVSTTPYLGEAVRVQIDDAGNRRPLAIGGRSFVGGITARPRSRVSYPLNTPAAYLIGWVGLDPLRGNAGICDVRIESDGKTLVRFDRLTAGAGERRIAVAITDLKRITLTTDFGPNAEIGDCVNWCELILVEKKR